ncbi:MAG: response regulator [Alphaproteobacteria bacterium]|nr:response regulator [Alphaproteobacteria bacterium]
MAEPSTQMRQFARLVLGEQVFGDEIERAASAMSAADEKNDRAGALREMIVRWRDVAHDGSAKPFSDAAVLAGTGAPPDDAQSVLLLNDVMGFSTDEICRILDCAESDVPGLLQEGRKKYASRASGNLVIVEDDPLIASDLEQIAEELGIEVQAVETKAEPAIEKILECRPDVVLLDFSLEGDKTGADVFNAIRERHDCAVIFVTAFPGEALTGADMEPDLVIGKPYTDHAIRAAIAHALAHPRPALTVV